MRGKWCIPGLSLNVVPGYASMLSEESWICGIGPFENETETGVECKFDAGDECECEQKVNANEVSEGRKEEKEK